MFINTAGNSTKMNKNETKKKNRIHIKEYEQNIEQVLAAIPHKAPTIRPPASHHENYPN